MNRNMKNNPARKPARRAAQPHRAARRRRRRRGVGFAPLLIGVVLVLYGIVSEILKQDAQTSKGIWFAGIGTVLTVVPLLLLSAWNHTAYYPSTADLQSSLTLENSCSSYFTLNTMFWVSLLVPFVLAYIVYAWRKIDSKKIDQAEIAADDHAY